MIQFSVSFSWRGSVDELERFAKPHVSALGWEYWSTSTQSGPDPFSNGDAKTVTMQWTDGPGSADLTIAVPDPYQPGALIRAAFNGGQPPIGPQGYCGGA
jgi:hypothetical protein